MVATICPIVHGKRKRTLRGSVLLLHGVGYIVGATVTGAVLGELGKVLLPKVPQELILYTTASACLLCSLREFSVFRVPLLESRARVPATWRSWPLCLMASIYGCVLGIGFGTRLVVSDLYVVAIWCLMTTSAYDAAIAMAGYGFGRALPFIVMAFFSNTEKCDEFSGAFSSQGELIRVTNGMALAWASTLLACSALV